MTTRDDLHQFGTWDKQVSGQWHLPGQPGTTGEHRRTIELVKQLNELANTNKDEAHRIWRELLPAESHVPGSNVPVHLEYAKKLYFGKHCFINFNAVILAQAPVRFGDYCMVGPNCSFITINHPVNDHEMRKGGWEQAKPITVGENTWFGSNCTVLPGVTIGKDCVIGAGTLVTKDVPDNSLVLGSPGHVVRTLSPDNAEAFERKDLDGPVEGFGALDSE